MFNEIFSDLWKNYRGRLLGSLFGLLVGAMFLILGFFADDLSFDLYHRRFSF